MTIDNHLDNQLISSPPLTSDPSLPAGRSSTLSARPPIDPNNPPWGVFQALLTWAISVVLLIIVPLAAVVPYILYRMTVQGSVEGLENDPNVIFISILGVLPAHSLTFLVAWLVVTYRGRLPFWKTIGWSWPKNFGPWKTIGLTVVLLGVGFLITWLFGGAETQLDQIVRSSAKARFVVAFLAGVTSPFVEELVYRGVMYAALQRSFGALWAVIVVSALFAGVHVLQYYNNLGVILVITILSIALTLLRARTGRLLPSYVMHLVFNGIQSVILLLQPYFSKPADIPDPAPALRILGLH